MDSITEKLYAGIIVFISVLAGFGGAQYIDSDMLDNTYVCTSNDKLAYCTGNPSHLSPLSVSAKSCYYVDADSQDKYKRCLNGVFQPMHIYAELNDIDPNILMHDQLNTEDKITTKYGAGVIQYKCSQEGCERL